MLEHDQTRVRSRRQKAQRHQRDKKTTARERELARERQRQKRKRDRKSIVPFPGRASADFLEAMKARARFSGASKQEAERDADDPQRISELAFAVMNEWVPIWYSKK